MSTPGNAEYSSYSAFTLSVMMYTFHAWRLRRPGSSGATYPGCCCRNISMSSQRKIAKPGGWYSDSNPSRLYHAIVGSMLPTRNTVVELRSFARPGACAPCSAFLIRRAYHDDGVCEERELTVSDYRVTVRLPPGAGHSVNVGLM